MAGPDASAALAAPAGRPPGAAAAAAAGGGEPPPLGEVIERIGMGPAQMRIWTLTGGVWLADGAEMLLISSVTRAVSEEWGLPSWQQGAVVSVVFIGMFVGNMLSGTLGDVFGRRLPILLSYVGVFVFSILSAMTAGPLQLAGIRLVVGVAIGIGQPAIYALNSETTPARWRIPCSVFMMTGFIVGEFWSAALIWYDDSTMENLRWRWLLVMGVIPTASLGVLALWLLPQSPSYLVVNGCREEALQVLESMRDQNGAHGASVAFKTQEAPRDASHARKWLTANQIIWGDKFRFSTLVVLFALFTGNIVVYGTLYAFPQVATDIDFGVSAAAALAIGAVWEALGALVTLAGMYCPRKPMMAWSFFAMFASLVVFTVGVAGIDRPDNGDAAAMFFFAALHGGYLCIKISVNVGFAVTYQYSAEIYPTVARTTGFSASTAGARVGGFVAPLFCEFFQSLTGRHEAYFLFLAAFCAVTAVLILFLPFETFGKSLDSHMDETAPILSKA